MSRQRKELGEQARDLAEMWSHVSRQHVAAGAGCSCGMGGLFLQASDFESDIVDFVMEAARKAGRRDLQAFIEAVAARGADRYSLNALLNAVARADHALDPSAEDMEFALQRLGQTLSSMDASHSPSRFACD